MSQRIKTALPLSLAVGLLAFVWLEVSLNFTFHWATAGDLGIGLALPGDFQLVAPAAFITWATFFSAGADGSAFVKACSAAIIGSVGGLVLMIVGPQLAELPDFWGLALVVGILAFGVLLASVVGDWYYAPGILSSFAAVVFWWFATGLDRWAPNGGGVGNSIAALGKPETAGTGAFGGVLSTPALGVFLSILASLLCGCVLGLVSAKLAGLAAPAAKASTDRTDSALT